MDAYISKPLAAEQLIRLTERTARVQRQPDQPMRTVHDEGDSGEGCSSVWDEGSKPAVTAFQRPAVEDALDLGALNTEKMDSETAQKSDVTITDEGVTETGNPLTSSSSLIDREVALKRMGGDRELLDGLIECFIEDAPGLLDQLDKALMTENAAEVARSAHSLKGLAANFEAAACRDAAAVVEKLGLRGELADAASPTAALKQQVVLLVNVLKSEQP